MGVSRGTASRSRVAAKCVAAAFACYLGSGCDSSQPDDGGARGGLQGESVATEQLPLVGSRSPGGARRLSAAQYKRTIADILGPDAVVDVRPPADALTSIASIYAFEAAISADFADRYEANAFLAAAAALDSPSRLAEHAPCVTQGPTDPNFRHACYQQVAHRVGLLAFRQPPRDLTKDMLVDIAELAEADGTSDADKFRLGLQDLIATILQAPSFLYSTEVGTPSGVPDEFSLNAFELASRLSLFLLGRGPSEGLIERAAAGELSTPAGIRAVAADLLALPEARDGLADQIDEIFQLKLLPTKGKDDVLFPFYDADLQASMLEEAHRFVFDIVLDSPRSFINVLTEEQRFVDARLATDIYAIPPPASDWDLVDFSAVSPDQKRAGIMTLPIIMTIQSHPASNSITRRGIFVMASLLCQTVPPVPRIADTSIELVAGQTLREFMEAGPGGCGASCHDKQDSMGFAFENFDPVGRFRTDEPVEPPPATEPVNPAMLTAFEMFNLDPFPAYADVREWASHMTDPARGFSNCMLRQAYRNAVGSSVGSLQEAEIASLDMDFASSGYLFTEALLDLVSSPLFTQVGVPR
jgi:hypothetical protein